MARRRTKCHTSGNANHVGVMVRMEDRLDFVKKVVGVDLLCSDDPWVFEFESGEGEDQLLAVRREDELGVATAEEATTA